MITLTPVNHNFIRKNPPARSRGFNNPPPFFLPQLSFGGQDSFVKSKTKEVFEPSGNEQTLAEFYGEKLDELDKNFYSGTRKRKEILIWEQNKFFAKKAIELFDDNAPVFEKRKTDKKTKAEVQEFSKIALDKLFEECSKGHDNGFELFSTNEFQIVIYRLGDFYNPAPEFTKIANEIYYKQDDVLNIDVDKLRKIEKKPAKTNISDTNAVKFAPCELTSIFINSKDLTYEDLLISKYPKNAFYDLPVKFAIAAHNEKTRNSNAYICDCMPQMFEGADKNETFLNLDILSGVLRNLHMPEGVRKNIKMNGEMYRAEYIGGGVEGDVFRIKKDGYNETVIMKIYIDPKLVSNKGCCGGIGIQREACRAGCSDVARLMLANPLSEEYEFNGEKYSSGCWQISEDVSSKPPAGKSKPFLSWLKKYRLKHNDLNYRAVVNGYVVDFGFVGTKNISLELDTKYKAASLVFGLYNCGYDTGQISELFENKAAGRNRPHLF